MIFAIDFGKVANTWHSRIHGVKEPWLSFGTKPQLLIVAFVQKKTN